MGNIVSFPYCVLTINTSVIHHWEDCEKISSTTTINIQHFSNIIPSSLFKFFLPNVFIVSLKTEWTEKKNPHTAIDVSEGLWEKRLYKTIVFTRLIIHIHWIYAGGCGKPIVHFTSLGHKSMINDWYLFCCIFLMAVHSFIMSYGFGIGVKQTI